jgi:hypothetical protein
MFVITHWSRHWLGHNQFRAYSGDCYCKTGEQYTGSPLTCSVGPAVAVPSVSRVVSPSPVALLTADTHTLSERRSWSLARSPEEMPSCGRFPHHYPRRLLVRCSSVRVSVRGGRNA